MARYEREISDAIKTISGANRLTGIKTCNAEVVSVNKPEYTAIVNSLDSKTGGDGMMVRIMPEVSDGDIDWPEIDSTVIIAFSDFTDPYIVKSSFLSQKEIIVGDCRMSIEDKKITIEQGEEGSSCQIVIDNGKIEIKNGQQSLYTLLKDILTHITQQTYQNGAGATGPPTNLANFQTDLANLDKILK